MRARAFVSAGMIVSVAVCASAPVLAAGKGMQNTQGFFAADQKRVEKQKKRQDKAPGTAGAAQKRR